MNKTKKKQDKNINMIAQYFIELKKYYAKCKTTYFTMMKPKKKKEQQDRLTSTRRLL